MLRSFVCKYKKQSWPAQISDFKDYGSHCEFWIISRSSIMVTFGQTSRGYFACMPDFRIGCHLSHLNDVFWNAEKLSAVLGSVDGVTVASALLYLQKELRYPEF